MFVLINDEFNSKCCFKFTETANKIQTTDLIKLLFFPFKISMCTDDFKQYLNLIFMSNYCLSLKFHASNIILQL